MAFLQGSSYGLPIVIEDCEGNVVNPDVVERGSFTIGEITKEYDGSEESEVQFDWESNEWVVPLSEEETFALDDESGVKWQARFLFKNGKTDGTVPVTEYVYASINRTRFTGGGEEDA